MHPSNTGLQKYTCPVIAVSLRYDPSRLTGCKLCIFFGNLVSGIETPDRNGQWYQHLLTLFAIFMRAIPKGLPFGLCLYLLRLNVMCMFCIVLNLCTKFEIVKSPEVTLNG